MDHIIQKNSTDVMLGGFEPNQSYLVTGLDNWVVGKRHVYYGFYPIKEVNNLYSHTHCLDIFVSTLLQSRL